MNAIRLHTANGPAGLVYEQIETPQPKEAEVLVRVHAAAITRDELDWPVNRLPAILPTNSPGWWRRLAATWQAWQLERRYMRSVH